MFVKATRENCKLRLALTGGAGCGKSYSALAIATALGERVAVIDSEHGSARKYADEFAFDVLELPDGKVAGYIDGMHAAARAGYDVVVIDSLSHAWSGADGVLDQVGQVAERKYRGNRHAAWADGTALQRSLLETMLSAPFHLIVTMRSRTEWAYEEHDGRRVPVEVGTRPEQRSGIEYEFDIAGELDHGHSLVITKTRCSALDGIVVDKPGAALAAQLAEWLGCALPGTWEHDKRRFLGALQELDIAFDVASEWTRCTERGEPATMTVAERHTMIRFLRSKKGRAEFDAWLAEHKKGKTKAA